MKNRRFTRYYLLALVGVLALSFYPLYMGGRVALDMLAQGTVMKENYPKYIIPYTPIAVAVLLAAALMPVFLKKCKGYALPVASSLAVAVFFGVEVLLERTVVVTSQETVTVLEDWQMFMCYVPPEGWGQTVTSYKQQTPVDILMGNYNPAFKLHFYAISLVLILSALNCLYGFGQMLRSGDGKRRKALILQSVASAAFLGLCILACFTAFWRDGSLEVSPLSASLMAVFFVLMGLVGGIYTGSFFLDKGRWLRIGLPALVASALTALMYAGEMILLHGNLYILGKGFFFKSIPGLVLAPADIAVVALSGALTALLFSLGSGKKRG